jgi:acetyl esterase/lipase
MTRFLFCAVALMSVCSQPLITIAGSASPMAEDFTSDIVQRKNLAYVTGGSPSQTLDLYAPKKANEVPLIVWIHGGAFLFGSKEGFPVEPVPVDFLLEGYAVASINYRLSPEAVFPAQLEDCKAAIRWLRAHADELVVPMVKAFFATNLATK